MSLIKRMTESLNESSYVRDNGSFTMSYLSMIEKELDKYDFPTDGVDPDRIESTKYYDNFDRTRVLANIQIDPEFEVIYTYIEIGINNTVSENEFNLSEIEEALNWCELNAKKYVKKRMTESLNNSILNENIESVYKNCQIIENEDGLYSIIYKGIEVADNFKNRKSAKIAIDQEMKTWPNDPWGQGTLTESLTNSTLNEDVNVKTKKLHEYFNFFEEENNDLYYKFVKIAKRFGFTETDSGSNFIEFEAHYDDYRLKIDVVVHSLNDNTEIDFMSKVYLPSGGDGYEYKDDFDSLEAAIDWGEKIIVPRAQLLRKIRKLINDSNIKDITIDELGSLTD